MPQFDQFVFFSQIFWLVVHFSFFYLVITYFFLPAFTNLVKIRLAHNQKNNEGALVYFSRFSKSISHYLKFVVDFQYYHNNIITSILDRGAVIGGSKAFKAKVLIKTCPYLGNVLGKVSL
jgi:hypothetical protein